MAIIARSLKNYQVEIDAGNHQFTSDEPAGIGDDAGPCPFDLLLSSMASCTVITLQMYARRKKWPLEKVEMQVEIHSVELLGEDGSKTRSSMIDSQLTLHGPLTAEQLKRLEEISTHCPIHRVLKGDIEIRSTVAGR